MLIIKDGHGYDVVDSETGVIVGVIERTPTEYAKPTWLASVAHWGALGRPVAEYIPAFSSRHGGWTIKEIGRRIWAQSGRFRRPH